MAGGVLATVALVAALIFLQTWEYGYRWYISAIVLIIALPIIWHFQFQVRAYTSFGVNSS